MLRALERDARRSRRSLPSWALPTLLIVAGACLGAPMRAGADTIAALDSGANAVCSVAATGIRVQTTTEPFVWEGGGWKDVATGLVWSQSARYALDTDTTWSWAMSYCDGLVEGGYSDWRAPTVAELQQVANDGAAWYLDFGAAGWNWTRTKVWSSQSRGRDAYSVLLSQDSDNGLTTLESMQHGLDVVAVRGGSPPKKGKP